MGNGVDCGAITIQLPYRVRLATPDDQPAILSLLQHLTSARMGGGPPLDLRYSWLHENNPDGCALTWIAEDSSAGQVIACTSCLPRWFFVGGSVILGSVGADTVVHPDWRRRGTAVALHRASNDDLSRVGLGFHCGFGTKYNRRALQEGGSIEFGTYYRLALPLSAKAFRFLPAALTERILRWWLVRKNERREQHIEVLLPERERVWDELQSLWEESSKGFLVRPVRGAAFFRWRYGEAPGEKSLLVGSTRMGRIEGFAAVTRVDWRYSISDFFARSEAIAMDFLAHLQTWLQERGAGVVSIIVNCRGPYYQVFRRMGFIPRERTPFSLYVVPGHCFRKELSNPRGWHIMKADMV